MYGFDEPFVVATMTKHILSTQSDASKIYPFCLVPPQPCLKCQTKKVPPTLFLFQFQFERFQTSLSDVAKCISAVYKFHCITVLQKFQDKISDWNIIIVWCRVQRIKNEQKLKCLKVSTEQQNSKQGIIFFWKKNIFSKFFFFGPRQIKIKVRAKALKTNGLQSLSSNQKNRNKKIIEINFRKLYISTTSLILAFSSS